MNSDKSRQIHIALLLPSPWTVALILGLTIILWAGTAVAQGYADVPWRIKLMEAATVSGPTVTLGEIAAPVGDMPAHIWQDLSARELWPSPEEKAKPMTLSRQKLKQLIRQHLGPEIEAACLLPGSMAVQRGGVVLHEPELHQILVKTLTPLLAAMPGETSLSNVKLPSYIFLGHAGQEVRIEPVNDLSAGRTPLRILIVDLDKSVVRRLTGSVFLDVWATVPAAAFPVNKGDVLTPDKIMFVRKNLAYLRGELWDGIGGPHRLRRAVGAEQVIYVSDLDQVPLIIKGAQVTLVYQRGTVRLEVPAEATGDGAPGQLVAVRNLQSRKIVKAMVQDSRTVVVN